MSHKELVVSALENGTVLDHIPAENVYKALDLLDLKGIENQITIGINLTSKAQGKKGIIKIEDKFFEDEELNKLALIAPHATVNVIRDFKVVEKKKLSMPAEVVGIAKCVEMNKCMLCGKCRLLCPRGINTRGVVMLIKRKLGDF